MGKAPDVKFPKPLDPQPAIAQQQEGNLESAIASTLLNQVNQYGPGGSSVFSPTGESTMVGGQSIPQFQQNVTLSPEAQAQYDQQQALGTQLTQLAGSNFGAVADAQSQGFNTQGLPQLATGVDAGNPIGAPTGGYGQVQGSVDGFGGMIGAPGMGAPLTSTINNWAGSNQGGFLGGPGQDYSQRGNEVEQATFDRAAALMQPGFDQQMAGANIAMTERGLPVGSEAGNGLFQPILQEQNRAMQNASFEAVLAGRQEQERLAQQDMQRQGQQFGQGMEQSVFGQSELQRLFGQGLAGGQFANEAQQQAFAQAMGLQGAQNQAQAQSYQQAMANAQMQNTARNTAYQELAHQRGLPINEIATLLGTAPGVQMPQFQQQPAFGVQNTDAIGAILGANQQNINSAQYQQEARSAQTAAMYGLAGSIGGAALGGGGMFGKPGG